jgi:formylmethanofuran dehydrogenase subunit C
MTVRLRLVNQPDIPLEADIISPSHFAKKGPERIARLPIHQGNQTLKIEDFFKVDGESGKTPQDTQIVVTGDLRRVKMIGKDMDGGRIQIEGDVGMHLGAEMKAGRIHVRGSVDAWAGAEMSGGNIQIEGDAGDYLCAGYRGSMEGMRGGRVYVAGNVGREMASHMRRGFIAVKGNIGAQAAPKMQGGTIIALGNIGERIGINATRGMIVVCGKADSVMPTYRFSGDSPREFINYYLRYLQGRRPDFLARLPDTSTRWMKFIGDFAEGTPREDIYFLSSENQHLC